MDTMKERILIDAQLAQRYPALARLISVAANNQRLSALLLQNPVAALEVAPIYGIRLSADERTLVLAVENAHDMQTFVYRLVSKTYEHP